MSWTRAVLALGALLAASCTSSGPEGTGSAAFVAPEERIAGLRAELAARPDDVGVLRSIGDEHLRAGQWPAAAGAYREALLVRPGDREAALGYGRALIGGGRYEAALVQITPMLQVRRDRETLSLAGVAAAGIGRTPEAVGYLGAARNAQPRDLAARTNLALALALAGDPEGHAVMRSAAFAPDADLRHRRNAVLVAGILGRDAEGRADGRALGLPDGEVAQILAIGRRARSEGASAFGVASAL